MLIDNRGLPVAKPRITIKRFRDNGNAAAAKKIMMRGALMPGAQCNHSLACEIDKAHERSHHRFTGVDPAFPAQWFYGLLRALPGDQACLTPSPALLIADLTPASGRQNHTTWPYASASFVRLAIARLTLPRPPHPAPRS